MSGMKRKPGKEIKRRRALVSVIRTLWSSLDSHLDAAVGAEKRRCDGCGGPKFHADCVREYTDAIKKLADVL